MSGRVVLLTEKGIPGRRSWWAGRVKWYHIDHTRLVISFRWPGQDDNLVTGCTHVKLWTKQEVRAYALNTERI